MTRDERPNEQQSRTQAVLRRSRWPGWIWAVPIAAIGIAGWLLVREVAASGVEIVVTFPEAPGIRANSTKVTYRGVAIGHVTSVALADKGQGVALHIDIDDSQKAALNAGTHFYLEGAHPSFSNLSTLKAIVAGPTIVMAPGHGAPQKKFNGIEGEPPPSLAVTLPYLADFTGDVGDLKVGTPVTLRGFTVGDVHSVRITVDPNTGAVATPVVLMLDPLRFNIKGKPPADGDWSTRLNATLEKLVQNGLRARLTRVPAVIGAPQVVLAQVSTPQPAALRMGGPYPEIPTAQTSGVESLVKQAGQLPIAAIGNNVQTITAHVAALSASPRLKDAIKRLDQTITELDKTVKAAGPEVAPAIKSMRRTVDALRKTAAQIDSTATALKNVAGGTPTAANGNLRQALIELSEAGRAVRSLADYLDQHPGALIKGRTNQ